MAGETKRISFGFSKLKKPNILIKPCEINKPEVDYVDSFDGAKGKFSYKGNVRCDEPVKKELVIPLIGTRTALDVIRSKLEENKKDQDIIGEKTKSNDGNDASDIVKLVIKEGERIDGEPKETKIQLSMDDLAANEIINDLHNNTTEEKASNSIIIKQPNQIKMADEKDAPIDYENIPVNDFGLAMLRGMGWTPETGIGKEQKVVEVVAPKLRPKGLGLGADKVVLKPANKDSDLTISIKSYVKFLNGLHKGKYGQVESMDEDNGRVIVKLALGGTVSVSEMLLMPVAKKDYEKNSKVLNPTTYESFKEPDNQFQRTDSEGKREVEKSWCDTGKNDHHDNRHRKEKYDRRESRDRIRLSEREGICVGDDRKKARHSSSSSSERKTDSKKKKKGTRDESGDRKHKKSKKKKRKKKRKYSSDEESDISESERKYDRERSRNHSKSKKKM